jgi:hypothetical protein
MGYDAGERDTLSSEKRGYRTMLKAKERNPESKRQTDEVQPTRTCPKKNNPNYSGLDL